MSNAHPYLDSPRCHARSKRTGKQCGAPAVTGWKVCRHHGAGGGAPSGERNGNYRHGRYTREAIALRKALTMLLKESRDLIAAL